MRNVILVDFCPPSDWVFCNTLEKITGKKWETISVVSNRNHGSIMQNIIRYFKYAVAACRIFASRKQYETVIAWQQFHGIILAALLRLFRTQKTFSLTVMTFIYKPKKSVIGSIYYRFVEYAVNSDYIDKIIVFSEYERAYYSKLFASGKDLFEAVSLGIEDQREEYQQDIADKGYCVSAGRSNRDYDFLIDSWDDERSELIIICDSLLHENTENVRLLKSCYGDDYLRMIAGSHAVIISLKDDGISSGQLVLLHAMMLGKPVIMTRNTAMNAYILDGITGILIDKEKEQLSEALLRLGNETAYTEMSKNARKFFLEKFTLEKEAEQVALLVRQQVK